MDQLLAGRSGWMTALSRGRYKVVELASILDGLKRVDVDLYYDTREYRADIKGILDAPMFLT